MSKPVCSCCVGLNMIVSTIDGSRGMIVPMRCKSWKCPECGCDLRKKWRQRAADTFDTAPAWELAVCSEAEFQSLSRRIRRVGDYYRIRRGDESYVFHTALPKTRQHTPDPSNWLSPSEVLAAFTAILEMPDISRVSCSRCLSKVAEKPPSIWKREAVNKKSVGEVNHFLERLKVVAKLRLLKTFHGRLIDVILLRDFPDWKELTCPRLSSYATHSDSPPKNRTTRTTEVEMR